MLRVSILFIFMLPALLSGQVRKILEEWKKDKDLSGATYGFCVMNIKTGDVITEYDSHKLMVPASTLKVVTTTAALSIMRPDYRYATTVRYSGDFDKVSGVLDGDLIIVGSGDPTILSENFNKDNSPEEWVKSLVKLGLKEIKGKIIGEASGTERAIPGEWIWADIGNYFGATPCGLSCMDNKFKLVYNSGASGSEAKLLSTSPNYINKKYELKSNVISQGTEDEAYVYGDPYSFQKEIRGSIPPNKTNYEVEAALPDPALLCAELVGTELEKASIAYNKNNVVSNYDTEQVKKYTRAFSVYLSPQLDKIVYYTNLKSNNFYCESILNKLGHGKMKSGLEEIQTFCKERGLNTDELHMVDGSGLSRANTVTASFITRLLTKASKDSLVGKSLKKSFPVAGKSGSMVNIGKGKFIEGNLYAKTGYINRVRAYCGYVTTRSGKELAFSVMLNNYTCTAKEAKTKLEKFMVELGEL